MFNTELVSCPVCKDALGKRVKTECFIITCVECNQVWMWAAKAKAPKPIVKQKAKNECGCGRCGR